MQDTSFSEIPGVPCFLLELKFLQIAMRSKILEVINEYNSYAGYEFL